MSLLYFRPARSLLLVAFPFQGGKSRYTKLAFRYFLIYKVISIFYMGLQLQILPVLRKWLSQTVCKYWKRKAEPFYHFFLQLPTIL